MSDLAVPHSPRSKEEGVECTLCEKVIPMGEEAVELFHGKVGRGVKSGQPMIVASNDTLGSERFHLKCLVEFYIKNIYDQGGDPWEFESRYCDNCGIKLDGDKG